MSLKRIKTTAIFTALLLAGHLTQVLGAALPDPLPDPDGKPADMSKPVKVFILMGQSNMLGFGKIGGMSEGALEYAVKEKGLYPYLVDEAGNWTTRKDVRYVQFMQGKGLRQNDWLTPKGSGIGPELGIGHALGYALDEPVMVLKSCIGNRGLGWDLLPPGSEPYEYNGKIYAGYKQSPSSWDKGTEPKPIGWYAGKNYDDDTGYAKEALADLQKYYPGANGYEVAGFFWWQGDKDMRNPAYFTRYEQNLQRLMDALRKDFDAPDAKFVFASLGQTKEGDKSGHGQILDAMRAVSAKNKGIAATVYTHPLSKGGSSSGHYNKHAETYMNVGEAMGKAMAELLGGGGAKTTATSAWGGAAKPAAAPAEMRTWTSASGSKVEARLVSVFGSNVTLETPDGRKMQIDRSSLSKADQDYLVGR